MRSQKDPVFSSLCDRVGTNDITEDDVKYLESRIQPCEEENTNENFKNGSLSVIVTTNKQKDHINNTKLCQLLPDEKEYICNSEDRVTNVPYRRLPDKMKSNPGKTANLLTELRLRRNAPILLTSNHPKKKYKEDGLVNGARGFVQSIQVSKENPEKVEVIWVVFKNENIGKLYRFHHKHLRKVYDPGHWLATPIFPERKKFSVRNIEYQRTNFPLALAYAMTAHKCQGDTLETVIIDYGPNPDLGIKIYIVPGSFYVALTRVREGKKVFLRSFDRSYIKVDKKLKEKIEYMMKYQAYHFKKIFLDDQIFKFKRQELKLGYLNINGLVDGGHAEYLNADHNLRNLDILVLAETKLDHYIKTSSLSIVLNNWNIAQRFDSNDKCKHMGLMILTNKDYSYQAHIKSTVYLPSDRDRKLQSQSIKLELKNELQLGFLYCRSDPNMEEAENIKEYFQECNVLLGDFNLSHRLKRDMSKIETICNESKTSLLTEITRKQSNNQLDYVLVTNDLIRSCYATSYNNFISDHNAITVRIGLDGNIFSDVMKQRTTFDRESHLKSKRNTKHSEISSESSTTDDIKGSVSSSCDSENEDDKIQKMDLSFNQNFSRKFLNKDLTTCWLNSSLQLVLNGIDHLQCIKTFTSELGRELTNLRSQNSIECLDATLVKQLLTTAEDIRIATRMSELTHDIKDENLLRKRLQNIEDLRLNLAYGQQCIRDFLLCISQNSESWPDLYSCFSYNISHSSTCMTCNANTVSHTEEIHVELDVPNNDSSLSMCVQDFFNKASMIEKFCDSCNKIVFAEKRTQLLSADATELFIVLMRRVIDTENGYELNRNNLVSTNNVSIRYV